VGDLLREVQRLRTHMALVINEHGSVVGLATLEDLVEEIVGEIRDEYDDESDAILDEGNGSFLVSGKVDVDEVAQRLKVQIEREGFETVVSAVAHRPRTLDW
jgi:CBS domain containing-hemolysin-like protein